MASVFLSYDRDDADAAAAVAAALEQDGHSVWWDLHVRGGAEFAAVIEQALAAATIVVVLWSSRSVKSAWVRDEAADGRDNGKLIPVSIDGTRPPLGFRQFQTIDLRGWKRQKPHVGMRELLAAVREGTGGAPALAQHASPKPGAVLKGRRWTIAATAGLLLIAGAIAYWFGPYRTPAVPTVSVAAADNSPGANALARDLLVKLNLLQSARSGSMRLIGSDQGSGTKADLLFQAASGSDGASLVLLAGKDKSVLWSGDFKQGAGDQPNIGQQASYTAARVLGCALDGLSANGARLKQPIFKSYLNGCALLDETFFDDPSEALSILQQVTREEPRFKPGWAKRLIAETNRYQNFSDDEKRAYAPEFRRVIAEARRLHPEIPEAYVAEIELLPGRDFYDQIRLIDRAAKLAPDNTFVLAGRSLALLCVGRMADAVEDARRAARLDPLSPAIRSSYLQALMFSGQVDAARSELAEAERLWPDAKSIRDAKYRLELRHGNADEARDALRLIEAGVFPAGAARRAFAEARVEPTPPNVQHAIDVATAAYRVHPNTDNLAEVLFTLGEFGRTDELVGVLLSTTDESQYPYFVELLFRPSTAHLRADPRLIKIAAHLGLLDLWQRSGEWPDFCSEPALPYNCRREAFKLKDPA